jgi:predicted ATP-dependent endonuclease of OLD family
MDYQLKYFTIKRFRSLMNVELQVVNGQPVTICGENNIGKTNVLEALNIFFNHIEDIELYDVATDIPHHIFYGRGGELQNTELTGKFSTNTSEIITAKVIFKKDLSIEYKISSSDKAKTPIQTEKAFKDIIKHFKYFYVKSNNVDIPSLVSELFASDGLIKLDKKRAKQQKPLETLKQFQAQAQAALNDIQKELNQQLQELNILSTLDSNSSIKITFAEFDKLRDVVSRMTQVTIDDGNDHSISSKGSGAQRTALLTLMNYIASNANKKVIWGLDEPEIFLQPKAQKQLFRAVKKIAREKEQTVVMTTHSQHFIDLNNLEHTYLYVCDVNEKIYVRKKDRSFFEKSTHAQHFASESAKAKGIREHLGIGNNDGWNLLPYNIIVEGETDKKYLEALIEHSEMVAPNIIWSGSASKISGSVQFYNNLAIDLDFKPQIKIILDNDEAGRIEYKNLENSISKNRFSNLNIELLVYPKEDGTLWDKRGKNCDWEVEDFLPSELMFDSINKILKNAKYSIIKKKLRDDKSKVANSKTQIFKYAESAAKLENPNKEPFQLSGEGQKKSICLAVVKLLSIKVYELTEAQTTFLSEICE